MSDPLQQSAAPSGSWDRSSSPSPSPSLRQHQQQQQSAHIRFQDDVESSPSRPPPIEVPTGPLIEVDSADIQDPLSEQDDELDHPDVSRSSSPSPAARRKQKNKMSVMREQRNYGSTLSVNQAGDSSRSPSRDRNTTPTVGILNRPGTADDGAAVGRIPGPNFIELPSNAATGGSASPRNHVRSPSASVASGPKTRSFSFKKRAPSLGAASYASGAGPSVGFQRQHPIANGARKLLNRASLGFFGKEPDVESGSAFGPGGNTSGILAGTGLAGSPSGGARGRWRNLRRTQTLSVHQAGPGEGVLSPLNPDAYDDGYGYGHSNDDDKPRIPQMLPTTKPDPDSTPIPTLPFVVLCVVIFGEFSSAGVAGPFLFFMINEFKVGGEAEVGFWAGIVSAVFFFAQFLTSMLWASVANKHGRRVVLFTSLIGNCISLILFGTSTNLRMAIAVRLTQGLFNGAVGVAKGAVRDLTDPTNEARAYGIMGFCWGMGGIIGPILGGVLEHPVEKYPWLFGKSTLLAEYPYLLPCMITACSTGLGAILSLFISRDGGPRSGAIALPEKDTERASATAQPGSSQVRVVRSAAANVGSFGRSAGKRISGYFSNRGGAGPSSSAVGADHSLDAGAGESNISLEQTAHGKDFPRTFTQQRDWETGGPPSPAGSDVTIVTRTNQPNDSGFDNRSVVSHAVSRTSARRRSLLGGGSAYGYAPRQSRFSQSTSQHPRFGPSHARRDPSATPSGNQDGHGDNLRTSMYAPDFEEIGQPSGLSFAQRFLLANDDAVLSLTDLWVAAAIGDDGVNALDEDVFYDDEDYEDGDDVDEDEDEEAVTTGTDEDDLETDDENEQRTGIASSSRAFDYANQPSEDSPLIARRPLVPSHFANRKLSMAGRSDAASNSAFSTGTAGRSTGAGRQARHGRTRSRAASKRGRSGSASTAGGAGRMPLLYAQAGVEIPHSVSPMLSPNPERHASASYFPPTEGPSAAAGASGYNPALAGIPEGQSVRNSLHAAGPSAAQAPQLSTLREGAATSAFSRADTRGGAVSGISAVSVGTQSIWSLVPLAIVAQYGVMSWHSSTFDQVFMAFLVTDVKSGGLGLTAAHFAELIAAMAICQMAFQFHFYPTVGPPRGKFTHLTMFRMGLAIYLPCYTLFPFLRNFITSTDVTVMSGMILFASLRWLANVTAFTAVTVLMNAMTPPHLIPLTNGLAQTVSSFMRCVGPIVGGIVWARSIEGGVDAHAWPFNYHLGFWVVGIVAFCGFLHSLTIR
ncbi:hypothetical protein OC846_001163 [Tilletia horrida]|uniref:Major facilitator superfamily (MFS) profile domain-containing protein n=1 Tax=Tilletia horrida TaxID=155126 RepID=A0AAN6GUN5_9BASI|nr:hypothetical protein OC846_001163 [Tilletia horrida]